MTIKELYERLQDILEHDARAQYDVEVVVPISKPSIGGHRCSKVKSISLGFDWDNGKAFLHPQDQLVVKSDDETLYDMSSDFIALLYEEACEKQRKPWYFVRLERLLERSGRLKYIKEYIERRQERKTNGKSEEAK